MMKSLLFVILLAATSCVRYGTGELCDLQLAPSETVTIAAKAYTKMDCRRYLNTNVLQSGYQPIQICIDNPTDSPYFFSTSRVTLPVAPTTEVSRTAHTSTAGRIAGYGAATLLASPLFAVPAVVDGYRSCEANDQIDLDFLVKAARDCTIGPRSQANMILFVPIREYKENFTVTLIDTSTHDRVNIGASTH
ncbi:MAG: hypothetical protein S4CHLAM2_17410 [Chlamydiales bacterium]|nr:hypothetical protein [Chlamydiales bacterium]